MGDDLIKQVIVMRTDLGMRKGKMIAQGAHASMKVFFDRQVRGLTSTVNERLMSPADEALVVPLTAEMAVWVQGIFTKVCVRADSEEQLIALRDHAEAAGLPHALIQDAGRTEFHGVPTYTCLAIGPADAVAIDAITGELKLL